MRQPTRCQYCPFEACTQCCQTFVLNEPFVRCMNNECRREWTRQYTNTVFPKSFVNQPLKEHRKEVLFEQERALLPATQPYVERQIKKERLQQESAEIRRQFALLRERAHQNSSTLYQLEHGNNAFVPTERVRFVRACPDADCRGFLSSQWKCGLCNQWACSMCHEIKGLVRDAEHTCLPENVATASLLNEDTKICPTCGTGIFKIDGCNQMFCTECNTAFDWRTGLILTGNIHNPHYFEWIRRHGQDTEPTHQPPLHCGAEISHRFIRRLSDTMLYGLNQLDTNTLENRVLVGRFCDIARGIIHVRHVEMPVFQFNYEINNRTLRIQYMRNRYTETEFKAKLQIQQKR